MKERLLFVGLFRWNAGSSQTVIGYHRAAADLNIEVAVCSDAGVVDPIVAQHVPVQPNSWATHLVFAYEDPQFLSHDEIGRCLDVPRDRRVIIDTDAHWGPDRRFGTDSTGGIYGSKRWNALYTELSDLILQPRLGLLPQGAEYFPYFGVGDASPNTQPRPGGPDVQYIGNNWWRWEALRNFLTAAVAPGRQITVRGRWWDDRTCPGYREATYSDPAWLAELRVSLLPSVPIGEVTTTMGTATVAPVLSRPKLSELRMLLPRVFETISSGSLPHFPTTMAYLLEVLPEIAPFVQHDDDDPLVERLLHEPARYRPAQEAAAAAARDRFSFPATLQRLRDLVAA